MCIEQYVAHYITMKCEKNVQKIVVCSFSKIKFLELFLTTNLDSCCTVPLLAKIDRLINKNSNLLRTMFYEENLC